MKRIFIITICLISYWFNSTIAQTYTQVTNVKTPNNSTVQDVYSLTSADQSFNAQQIAALAESYAANYNGAILLEAPSYQYNCHAYAWHVSEGGNKVWIGRYTTTAEDIYWTDGSYVPVAENLATKVSYHESGNHSAIRLNSTWYQSKWGWGGPLIQHHPNDVPTMYNSSMAKQYYKRASPTLSGPNYVCTSGSTFTINNLSAGVSVSWQTSSSMYVVSSSGNSALISKVSNSATDLNGWVRATLQTGGTSVVLQKNNVIAWRSGIQNTSVGESIMQSGSGPYGCEFALYVHGSALIGSNFTWSIDNGWQPDPQGYFFSNITGNYFCGSFYVTVDFTDVCGMQSTIFKHFTVDCSTFMSYPNPVSNVLTVEAKSANTINTANMNTTKNISSFNIRLYDIQSNLKKTFSFTGEKYEIDLSSLPNGIYSMHISDTKNANTEIHKIIVKH
jgi:hypothetical protein